MTTPNQNQQSSLRKELNDPADEKVRNAVFFEGLADTILVKITGPTDLGLALKVRNEAAIDAKHAVAAEKLGVNAQAYRAKGDTGKPIFENENNVRLAGFIASLNDRGYVFTGGHKFKKDGKKHFTSVLEFKRVPVDQFPLPAPIMDLLANGMFQNVFVWANRVENGRLDTINVVEGQPSQKPGRQLSFKGKTGGSYCLIDSDK